MSSVKPEYCNILTHVKIRSDTVRVLCGFWEHGKKQKTKKNLYTVQQCDRDRKRIVMIYNARIAEMSVDHQRCFNMISNGMYYNKIIYLP